MGWVRVSGSKIAFWAVLGFFLLVILEAHVGPTNFPDLRNVP